MKLAQRIALGLALATGAGSVVFNPVSPDLHTAVVRFEGRRLVPYRDPVGVWTVCAGVTNRAVQGAVRPGKRYSEAECYRLEEKILRKNAEALSEFLPQVGQGQWDALMDFSYNVGLYALQHSTLLRKLKAGDCLGAAAEFSRWAQAQGKPLSGLRVRRAWEAGKFRAECP